MPARIQETILSFGKKKQAAIGTANVQGDLWRLNKVNATPVNPRLNTEDNAADIGKGHEFATQRFNTSWDVQFQIEKYLSSQFAAWAFAYALGNVAPSGAYVYTCTPLDPVTDGIELPYFSVLEQIRPGGSPVYDNLAIGCAIAALNLEVQFGPGRAASKLTVDVVGSGKLVTDSTHGLVAPTATPEVLLPSAGLEFTALTVDYVTLKRILAVRVGWNNNPLLDLGFYPGCGFQDVGDGTSGAIRGRIWAGVRTATLSFDCLLEPGSAEEAALKAGTTGTVTIHLANGASHDLLTTFHDVGLALVEKGEIQGLTQATVTCTPLYDSSNGLLTAVVKTDVALIGA